jgi:hypothetical protein
MIVLKQRLYLLYIKVKCDASLGLDCPEKNVTEAHLIFLEVKQIHINPKNIHLFCGHLYCD